MLDRPAFEVGRRVVVFTTDSASQATLGYYGTILRALAREQVSDDPYGHCYSLVRVKNSEWVVAGEDILPTSEFDAAIATDRQRNLEITYEFEPKAQNEQIQGSFKLSDDDVGYFRFRKMPQHLLTYHLHIPTAHSPNSGTVLDVSVPSHQTLDRSLVVDVLVEALIGKTPAA